jgi:hypothetical protein
VLLGQRRDPAVHREIAVDANDPDDTIEPILREQVAKAEAETQPAATLTPAEEAGARHKDSGS